ncbi:MAG: hypothetical protein J2P29_04635, partial [Actinobacteria bacterium]|nr:hypothetical protein [Actinomycetota bacterium]
MAAESDSGDEFGVDEQGRLDLPGWAAPAGAGAENHCPNCWPPDDGAGPGWEPDDEPGYEPEPWEDPDEDAWLRSMPPELRAEVEARP